MGQTGEIAASALILAQTARMKYDYTQRLGHCKDVKRVKKAKNAGRETTAER